MNVLLRWLLVAALVAVPGMARALPTVTVMTYNVYLGGDLEPLTGLIAQDPTDPAIAIAAGALFGEVQATDFSARATGIVAEIKASQPHVIGLQEVALWRTGPALDPAPAANVAFDFLGILQAQLAAEGLNYTVAAQRSGFDAELPAVLPGGFLDVRLTDRDVILVRDDVNVLSAAGDTFAVNLGPPIFPIPVQRGWITVDAEVEGTAFRLLNTHLEAFAEPISAAQALELVGLAGPPGSADLPLIFVGDFNSPAPGGTGYAIMTGLGGFGDAWLEAGSGPGLTCCNDQALLDPPSLTERIDFIFFRDGLAAIGADVIGELDSDRVAGLLYSDHAGVVASLLFVPEPGTLFLLLIGLAGAARFARRRR